MICIRCSSTMKRIKCDEWGDTADWCPNCGSIYSDTENKIEWLFVKGNDDIYEENK